MNNDFNNHEKHEKILFSEEVYAIQGAIFEVYREEATYEAPTVILEKLLKAEVGETNDTDLAKVQSGIVRELLELRGMIG